MTGTSEQGTAFPPLEEGENIPEFSVSALSGAIRQVIEGHFGRIRVRAEVGRVARPRSGHIYFDLKDTQSVLGAVIWCSVAAGLAMEPQEGLEVIATGRVSTYGGQSKYQLIIEQLRPAGVGALMAMLQKRKAALQAEGLFEGARKQPLPPVPQVIGVITSPSGAVIRDILHRLRDRFPVQVVIWPVAVQGKSCAPEVVRAIEGFNALPMGGGVPRPDILIVARGGGSVEDLWEFNDEAVVRAAAASRIPLISAVGHETDTTLIDFAADLRAPTPTAAAEMAVPVRIELMEKTEAYRSRAHQGLMQAVLRSRQQLRALVRALPRVQLVLETPAQRFDQAGERLPAALGHCVELRRLQLGGLAAGLGPQALRHMIRLRRAALAQWGARLAASLGPEDIAHRRANLHAWGERLDNGARGQLRHWRVRLKQLERLRHTLGYTATLERGFAVVWSQGRVITRKHQAQKATGMRKDLHIEFADGKLRLAHRVPP